MAVDTHKPMQKSVGAYDLIDMIAEGGMGTVYKARHQETGQIVAIKIVPPHMAGNAVLVKRFEQEFRAASRLDHGNIVRALDYGESNGIPYLVMEFVEGESLGNKIEREGRIPEQEAIRIVAQVAQGLHSAHKRGLIHRDVKPDNVLVTPDGTAKLADLGLVKEVEADLNLTRTGRGLGTPHFMAPEQFRNAKNVDVRCDIYSLGATLYMMVTGELPFRSSGPLDAWMRKVNNELTPPRKIVPTLSERIDWAIRRAMSAEPENRPATCREFVEDLTGHSTRRTTAVGSIGNSGTQMDVWYLVYKDEDDTPHTVKGTTHGIRRSLREGLLGDASNVRGSRIKTGPFEPLRTFPEFRDLVLAAGAKQSPATPLPANTEGALAQPSAIKSARSSSAARPSVSSGQESARTADKQAAPSGPLIDLQTAPSQNLEWLKWVLLVVIAVSTAVIAFFFLPK
jgi:serine/threonine protein kinase